MKFSRKVAPWVAAFATLAFTGIPSESIPGTELRIPGENWHDLAPGSGDAPWLALEPFPSGARVTPVRLRATRLKDAPMRQFLVQTDPPTTALFVVRGIEGLVQGPTRQWFLGSLALAPGTHVRFGEESNDISQFTLHATGQPAKKRDRIHFPLAKYELKYSNWKLRQHQTLLSVVSATRPPDLRWCGDLDHDGRPDLFIDLETGEATGSTYVLLLSSVAKMGEMLGVAAVFRVPAC